MNTTIKTILLLGIIGAVVGGGIAFFMYNKPHKNVLDADPDYTMTSVELFSRIEGKASTASAEFNDKIFEVSGTVAKTDMPDDSTANLFLAIDDEGLNNVICAVDAKYIAEVKAIKPGANITIKGIFSGVNEFSDPDFGINTTDIMLTRCVVKK